MRRLPLRDESGVTLVELVVASALMLVVVGALSNVFVSGLRAGTNGDARLTAQENVRAAFDRLEFEGRCADTVQVLSSGAGLHLHFPSQCTHATGDVSWCVSGGSLVRYAATTCTGTGQSYVDSVTAGTFSCATASGSLPQVTVALTVNPTAVSADATSASDTFTAHNGSACS